MNLLFCLACFKPDAEKMREHGIKAFLNKPYRQSELLEASQHWQIYNPSNFRDEDNAAEKPKTAVQNQILIVEDEAITAILMKGAEIFCAFYFLRSQ